MRAVAEAWSDESITQAVLAQLPGYHHPALLDKLLRPQPTIGMLPRLLNTTDRATCR
ncbi:hypothetical protein VJH64_12460 [Stutzerimonas nitrititolerans]